MELILSSIGNDIRNFRMEAGLSQEQLSTLCGVERAQLSKIEKGTVSGVTFNTIATIYDALGMRLIPVKEEVKKAPAKKAAAKTTAVKTTKAASVDTELYVQFAGNEVSTTDIVAKVKAAYIAEGHKESAIKAIKLYIKPEDSAVYYVINDKASGMVSLF